MRRALRYTASTASAPTAQELGRMKMAELVTASEELGIERPRD